MTESFETTGHVTAGKLVLRNRDGLAAAIACFPDGEVIMRIEHGKPLRSRKANNYYWSTVLPLLAKENEQTPEEVHDAMCELFLPNEHRRVEFFNRLTGEALTVECDSRRSSKLTGGPFYDFVERVRLWGLEFLGVVTPDPDPEYWRKRTRAAA